MRFTRAAALALILAGCTPNGVITASGGGSSVANITRINVSISAYGQQSLPAGLALGFSPEISNVTVGSGIQFVNVDNTVHTGSTVAGSTFPPTSPLMFSATIQAGSTLSGGFTSGTLQPGSSSQVILVDKAGTYLFGCFYHYSGTMRGEIVAQ